MKGWSSVEAAHVMISGSISRVDGDSICGIDQFMNKARDLTVVVCSRVL